MREIMIVVDNGNFLFTLGVSETKMKFSLCQAD